MDSSNNWQRQLQPADLGIEENQIIELAGTVSLRGQILTLRIDMILGSIKPARAFQIIRNLRKLAQSYHASVLVIEGSIADERLLKVVTRRYNAKSEGANERITLELD